MKPHQLFLPLVVLLSMLICSCAAQPDPTEPVLLTIAPTEPIETEPPTVPATEAPTEPIPEEPQYENYLGYEPGAYLYRFDCESTGDYMDYYVHVPLNAVKGMPLVIYLHGDGQVNNHSELEKDIGVIYPTRHRYGDEFPFISIAPHTRVRSWTNRKVHQTLKALIDNIVEEYQIDPEHIIIAGHSRGAIGVWKMISEYGDFFSAAIPISSPHETGHIYYENCAKVPVWAFCGDVGEREVSYHESMKRNVNIINSMGGWAKFTVLTGRNHGQAKLYAFSEDTFEWMLSQ